MGRARFLGLPLDALTANDLLARIGHAVRSNGETMLIGYRNAHTCNMAARDRWLAMFYRRCAVAYADGMAVVWAARRRGIPVPERVTAADFFQRFAWAASAHQWRVAFIGGSAGIAEQAAASLAGEARDFAPVLLHHGYDEESAWPELADRLKAAGAQVVLLGMGTPRQEKLALFLAEHHAAPVLWCVGALFEQEAGVRRRAPVWARRAGLEWAWRLAQEPGRMAQRYLLGNVEFVFRALLGN